MKKTFKKEDKTDNRDKTDKQKKHTFYSNYFVNLEFIYFQIWR
jgi:hypothetical protein